jgi:hypothetical protein
VDVRGGPKSVSSFEHSGQTGVPSGLQWSHCPQTTPMSCRSFCNVSSRSSAPRVLDVKHENGQAHEVFRSFIPLALALSTALAGCAKQGAPEQVADAFVDAYFRRADQEKAKEYTALGATEMLEKELRDVAQLRKDGYTPNEAGGGDVKVHRGDSTKRDQRIRFSYEIAVRNESVETVRDADVELANIRGAWKVVRLGLTSR